MEEKVLRILRTVVEDNSLDCNCSQDNCEAWDSLRHLNICFELEGEFGVVFQPDEMVKMKSFSDLLDLVKSKI